MKPVVIVILVAVILIFGLMISVAVVGGLVVMRMAERPSRPEPVVMVLAARQRMAQWTTIREPREMFDIETIEASMAPSNAITSNRLGEMKGRRLKAPLEAGAYLTEDSLLSNEVAGIDGMLEKGKRAVAVNISADKAVGFFVVPGSRVDVVHTVDGKSSVLLENVLVLAIDLNTSRPEDGVPRQVGGTATLQLEDNEQVLKLATAKEKGSINLVMRPPGEE
jgi:pilus assembly protein CpaB